MAKLIFFDFLCPDGHVTEDLVDPETQSIPCKCGKDAVRQLSAPRLDWRAMGVSTDFPTCAEKWSRMQRQKAKLENHNLTMY